MVEVSEVCCSSCGATNVHLYEVYGEGIYCSSCLDESFPVCSACGDREYADETITLNDGDIICSSCRCDYGVCGECGEYFHHDDLMYSERQDISVCEGCWDPDIHEDRQESRLISGYHDTDISAWLSVENGQSYMYRNRYYHYGGMEIEVEGGYIDDAARAIRRVDPDGEIVRLEHDGSLDDGFEIITNPMTWGYFNELFPLKDILAACRKNWMKSHDTDTCGLHIHMGWSAFGDDDREQKNTVLNLVYLVEKFRGIMFRLSRRRGNGFGGYVRPYNLDMDNPTFSEIEDKTQHYTIVSLRSETVELRMFKGTLKESSVRAAWEFYQGLIRVCRVYELKYIKSFSWDEIRYLICRDMDHLPAYIEGRIWPSPVSITMSTIQAHMDYVDADIRRKNEMIEDSFCQGYQEISPVGELIDSIYVPIRYQYTLPIPSVVGGSCVDDCEIWGDI